MVSFRAPKDEEDSSFEDDTANFEQQQQRQPEPRKRTYPVAFPAHNEEHSEGEQYPYRGSVPVVLHEEGDEWVVPRGLTVRTVMECFASALGWVSMALVEYGGKLFAKGMGV